MRGTLLVALSALVVVMAVFALTASSQVMTVLGLVLMGGFGFATVPALQMRVMTHAGGAPTLASGANIAAFNVGNALGAWLGGVTIGGRDHRGRPGYVSPIWAGAGLTALALVCWSSPTRAGAGPTPRRRPCRTRAPYARGAGAVTPATGPDRGDARRRRC